MMKYEAAERRGSRFPDSEWIVEAIDHASEGEIYAASLEGHNAEGRAREYADWKNSGAGYDWSAASAPAGEGGGKQGDGR